MSALSPRHSFTPQRSPSMPSSQVSQSPPINEAEAERTEGKDSIRYSEAKRNRKSGVDASTSSATQPGPSHSSTAGAINNHQNYALNCWTAHQSHGQVTILFYVPRWTKKGDLQIVIGSDYVIAGLREGKEKVIQARLAGRIDTSTSTWQLEKQTNKRSRSRSRSRMRGKTSKADGSHSSGDSSANSRRRTIASTSTKRKNKEGGGGDDGGGSGAAEGQMQRTASPASSSETSSFDILARSTDTLESGTGWDPSWNHNPEIASSPHSPIPGDNNSSAFSTLSSPSSSPPHRLDQSITLSEESGYIPSGSTSGGEGVRSLESSISFDPSHNSSNSQTRSEDDVITDAKLVTLHLDKIDAGIWPFMVSGPASLSLLLPSNATSSKSSFVPLQHQSLNAALTEALLHRDDPFGGQQSILLGGEEVVEEEGLDDSFTHSTTTVDTVGSDDSTTVLGVRKGLGTEEELYDMDPTSLTLMGIKHTKQGHRSPFGSASSQEESQAFEYFKRAWRRAEIPLATKRLVENYLPLPIYQTNTVMNPFRSRLMAALGGPSALARLYVSYARLQLPSSDDKRSPLAFPLGGLSNPFGNTGGILGGGGGGFSHDQMSSPRSPGSSTFGHDAILYLREARNLDKNVVISSEEWQEAQSLEIPFEIESEGSGRWDLSEGGGAGITSRGTDGERSSQGRRSPSKRQKNGNKKKRSIGGGDSNKRHREDTNRGNEKFSSSDQGLVFILVSRAALLSVMVAGGVAVAGWWRRAAAAGAG